MGITNTTNKNLSLKAVMIVMLLGISPIKAKDSVSLGLLGLSSHGLGSATQGAYEHMPRKVSKTGYTVWNPELNLTIESNGWLLNTTYVSDCMNKDAYYLGVGYRWNVSETLHVSILGGAYFVKDPQFKNDFKRIEGFKDKVIFAPWLSLEKDFKVVGDLYAFIGVSSNVALTHAVTGFKFNY